MITKAIHLSAKVYEWTKVVRAESWLPVMVDRVKRLIWSSCGTQAPTINPSLIDIAKSSSEAAAQLTATVANISKARAITCRFDRVRV